MEKILKPAQGTNFDVAAYLIYDGDQISRRASKK